MKKLAEEHASRLKRDNQQLQQEVLKLALVADYLRSVAIKSSREVNRVLERLNSEQVNVDTENSESEAQGLTFYNSGAY